MSSEQAYEVGRVIAEIHVWSDLFGLDGLATSLARKRCWIGHSGSWIRLYSEAIRGW